ncbi:type I 3-dehydroquinate dehydratase [uncultured Clostridium sp.]|uniref:type I 3-dehydroquinate dehydratase n=1 Tax=uncultured Clostridium sp. TaxID=59620 RepID=UPI0025CD65C8|nr:type I 3-dehydroquinate dehydratase [uncultured Clostridium sp.]
MKNVVKVRNLKLGEGIPKICVPLVGKTNEEILEEAKNLKEIKLDLVEWRIDHYENVENIEKCKEILKELREVLGETPILVTFRSKKEGGEREVSTEYYIELNKEISRTGMADLIDVELFTGDREVSEIVNFAHENEVKVVMSNHDFDKTPAKEEIVKRLCKMQELGADLPKIAVMPQTTSDVLTLLCATDEMVTKYADRPIITMSMAGLGVISRIAGETFGSALTFGAAKVASAPGQVSVKELNNVLKLMHESK